MRPVGWRYDSARHSLAARGVSTRRRYDVSFAEALAQMKNVTPRTVPVASASALMTKPLLVAPQRRQVPVIPQPQFIPGAPMPQTFAPQMAPSFQRIPAPLLMPPQQTVASDAAARALAEVIPAPARGVALNAPGAAMGMR